ncbi:TolC family protein [Bryobacter aggregatus]|uniref:TolC family protein n=1 Tax=Bryobacter aggregatus TaxID=360054 RepID=UPI00068B6344|nr:TolC family protein [Bryobacter aggregatus]
MRRLLPLLLLLPLPTFAQPSRTLTLQEATEAALQHHPRLASASLTAQAEATRVTQAKAAFGPNLSLNATGAGAEQGTALAAGTLQTSALASRAAVGAALTQLITDFGRTMKLAESAKFRAEAQARTADIRRAEILLQVHQAYYAALGAQAVHQVAQATLETRRLLLRQVRGLTESNLKSTLDLTFAELAVAEAELALYQADNAVRETHAQLSAAMGNEDDDAYTLTDVPLSPPINPDAAALVQSALSQRPELSVAKLNITSAQVFADAERRLRYPTITGIAVVGAIPAHQAPLHNRYASAGVNVTLPFLNGGLFHARRAEADLRASAAAKDAEDLSVQIASGVRVAWYQANTAYRRIDVTARMVTQADTAYRLARSRYEIGLGTIVELNQAQLAQTSAQIADASARYEFLIRTANLNFATGNIQ